MAKAKWKPEAIEKKHEAAKKICEDCAKEAKEKISKFYQEEIDTFYAEYDPFLYVRHHERGYTSERGLDKTYEEIYKEISKGDRVGFKGGITLSTKNMYDDYSGTQEQVLYSFLNGYHGLPPFPQPRKENTQFSIAPITAEQYGSGVHPLKDVRNFINKELEPELRKKHNFK